MMGSLDLFRNTTDRSVMPEISTSAPKGKPRASHTSELEDAPPESPAFATEVSLMPPSAKLLAEVAVLKLDCTALGPYVNLNPCLWTEPSVEKIILIAVPPGTRYAAPDASPVTLASLEVPS
jgi:hypothetical protein